MIEGLNLRFRLRSQNVWTGPDCMGKILPTTTREHYIQPFQPKRNACTPLSQRSFIFLELTLWFSSLTWLSKCLRLPNWSVFNLMSRLFSFCRLPTGNPKGITLSCSLKSLEQFTSWFFPPTISFRQHQKVLCCVFIAKLQWRRSCRRCQWRSTKKLSYQFLILVFILQFSYM